MVVKQEWAVLVSQTASEVIAISKEIGFIPSLLVTNRLTKIPQKNLEFLGKHGVTIRTMPAKPSPKDYLFPELMEKQLITLHGFLRILPEEFFTHYKGAVYNGHPALITVYPELKGFNKQEDIAGNQEKYPTCGSVVHKVIPELDSGEVVVSVEVPNTANTVEEAYSLLRTTSLTSWKSFLRHTWDFDQKVLF